MALWGKSDDAVQDTLRATIVALRDDVLIAEDRYNSLLEEHTAVCRQRRDDAETVCRAAAAEQDARIAWQADDNPTTRAHLERAQSIRQRAVAAWRELDGNA